MELNFTIKRKDFSDFNLYYYFRKELRKRLIVVFIAAFALPFINLRKEPFELILYLKLVVFVFFFFGVIYLGVGYIRIMTSGKILLKKGSILGEKKLSIDESGVSYEGETDSTQLKWKAILSVEENKNSIFLFVDKISAVIVPKRSFQDQNEMTDFLNFVNSHIEVTDK